MNKHRQALPFSVLMLSCDGYSSLWPGFWQQFKKHFKGEAPLYQSSNTKMFSDLNVKSLISEENSDWSSETLNILEKIDTDVVFVILEDIFLCSDLDRAKIDHLVSKFNSKDTNFIRYFASPKLTAQSNSAGLIAIPLNSPYRATVCGIWRRQILIDLIVKGETPWEFEVYGSRRSNFYSGFWTLDQNICEYKNMVEKGYWVPSSLEWALRKGLPVREESFRCMNFGLRLQFYFKKWLFETISLIPWSIRKRTLESIRRALAV